jgi:hypothetical protein
MTRFSGPYEEMEIIKIIIRAVFSFLLSLSLSVLLPLSLPTYLFLIFYNTQTCLCSLSVKCTLFI